MSFQYSVENYQRNVDLGEPYCRAFPAGRSFAQRFTDEEIAALPDHAQPTPENILRWIKPARADRRAVHQRHHERPARRTLHSRLPGRYGVGSVGLLMADCSSDPCRRCPRRILRWVAGADHVDHLDPNHRRRRRSSTLPRQKSRGASR